MKNFKAIASIGLLSILLFGCGTNNDNADEFTSNDNNEPLGVRYNPQDNLYDGYPNRTGVNDYGDRNSTGRLADDVPRNVGYNGTDRGQNRIDSAEKAADQVASLDEVDRAYVMVMDRNAYVAVKLKDQAGNKVSNDIQKKIASKVKGVHSSIDRVYVSENPDFYDRMRGYGEDIQNGKPVSGFFDEFSTMVERMFPNNANR